MDIRTASCDCSYLNEKRLIFSLILSLKIGTRGFGVLGFWGLKFRA